jgi:hypothetical protein
MTAPRCREWQRDAVWRGEGDTGGAKTGSLNEAEARHGGCTRQRSYALRARGSVQDAATAQCRRRSSAPRARGSGQDAAAVRRLGGAPPPRSTASRSLPHLHPCRGLPHLGGARGYRRMARRVRLVSPNGYSSSDGYRGRARQVMQTRSVDPGAC